MSSEDTTKPILRNAESIRFVERLARESADFSDIQSGGKKSYDKLHPAAQALIDAYIFKSLYEIRQSGSNQSIVQSTAETVRTLRQQYAKDIQRRYPKDCCWKAKKNTLPNEMAELQRRNSGRYFTDVSDIVGLLNNLSYPDKLQTNAGASR